MEKKCRGDAALRRHGMRPRRKYLGNACGAQAGYAAADHRTQAGAAGADHVKDLRRLENLDVGMTSVSDQGLIHLKALPLFSLLLDDTRVTDGGLVHLQGLPRLADLNVINTKVTEAGARRLKAVLPNCGIRLDQGLPPL